MQDSINILTTKKDAVEYLIIEGWDIKVDDNGKNSKLYNDLDGIPRKSGGWPKSALDKYARLKLKKADGALSKTSFEAKTQEETRLTKERADKVAFENKILSGSYVLREDSEQQLAARAAYLKSSIEGFFNSLAPRIAEIINGDQTKIPELTEFCLREIENFFHHYSKPLIFEAVKVKAEDAND